MSSKFVLSHAPIPKISRSAFLKLVICKHNMDSCNSNEAALLALYSESTLSWQTPCSIRRPNTWLLGCAPFKYLTYAWQHATDTSRLVWPLWFWAQNLIERSCQRVPQTRCTGLTVDAYQDTCRLFQKYNRALKSKWCDWNAKNLQEAADRNGMKKLYSRLKEVWRLPKKAAIRIKYADGWALFSDRYNCPR